VVAVCVFGLQWVDHDKVTMGNLLGLPAFFVIIFEIRYPFCLE
jgi:hypothetical protein